MKFESGWNGFRAAVMSDESGSFMMWTEHRTLVRVQDGLSNKNVSKQEFILCEHCVR